jgi:hypothetical protein
MERPSNVVPSPPSGFPVDHSVISPPERVTIRNCRPAQARTP